MSSPSSPCDICKDAPREGTRQSLSPYDFEIGNDAAIGEDVPLRDLPPRTLVAGVPATMKKTGMT